MSCFEYIQDGDRLVCNFGAQFGYMVKGFALIMLVILAIGTIAFAATWLHTRIGARLSNAFRDKHMKNAIRMVDELITKYSIEYNTAQYLRSQVIKGSDYRVVEALSGHGVSSEEMTAIAKEIQYANTR